MRFRFSIREMLLVFVIIALALGWWVDHSHWQWVLQRDNGLEQAAKAKVDWSEQRAQGAEKFANQVMNDYFRATGKRLPLYVDSQPDGEDGDSTAETKSVTAQ